MATRLSSLLVQDGLVSVKRMEEAFQRQVIYGGSLDTILLEMRALDEAQLLQYLELATGMQPVDLVDVFTIDAAALEVFPQMLAEAEGVAPLRLEGNLLRVLVVDPPDRGRLDQIGFNLGLQLDPRIAPQCRLFQAWHERYGLPIPARHASLAARLKQPPGEAAPKGPRRPVVLEPARPATPIAETKPDITAAAAAATAAARKAARAMAATVKVRGPVSEGPGPLSVEEATARIDKTTDRDEIFQSFARAAAGRLDFAVVFTVHGSTATGRVGLSRDGSHDVADVSLPLDGESVLASTYRGAAPYLGPPGQGAANEALFLALGREAPVTVVLVPVVIRGRVVAMLYGDRGDRAIEAARVSDLFTLGHEVGRAFLRLIMRAKKELYSEASGSEGQIGAVTEAPKPKAPVGDWARAEPVHAARVARAQPEPEPEPAPAPAAAPARAPEPEPPPEPEIVLEADAAPAPAGHEGVSVEVVADIPSGRIPLAPEPWGEPAREPPPEEPAVTLVSPGDVEALLREIELSPDSTQAHLAAASLERMGEQAIQVLVRHFPGRLRIDRFSVGGKMPPVAEHSAVLRLLINFGRPAVRHLLPLLASPATDIRYYATFIFSELVFAEVVPHVAARLYDPDYGVRAITVEVLRRYLATPDMKEVLERLRGDLPGPDPTRQRFAAEALGELRDVPAVPWLMELVDHRDDTIAEAARRALMIITKQDFGRKERAWRTWWQKNRGRHRVEWMLEGLGHVAPEIRLSSSEELRRLTHEHFGYHFDMPKREREEARMKWMAWWERVGRDSLKHIDRG